jgi:chromosome segregation ATPase
MNKSLRGELNQLNESLSQCQHENQNLNITLDELKRRSSLEQIHSAASSLKEQLSKVSKEKDLIKEQLTKAIKEREQLTNVANERDKVINSLKEKMTKLEKGEEYSFKTQLQDGNDKMAIPSKVNDQSLKVVEESGNVKEVETLKHELLLLNNDLIKKTKLWQKERSSFEEKCRRLEVELMNTREAQDMIKKNGKRSPRSNANKK